MALAGTGVFEVRTGGSDSNAGYFNPSGSSPGTDYTLQNAAQVTIDGVTITATVQATTTQILIAGISVTALWNRNGLRITGGTATAGLYEITAVNTGTNVITLDRSAGTSTQTATGAMGGALVSIGQAAALNVGSNVIYIKYSATPYDATTASTNVSGGCASLTNITFLSSYDTTRTVTNTDANRSTFRIGSGVSAATLFIGTSYVSNMIIDGNLLTTSRGGASGSIIYQNCRFQNFTNQAISTAAMVVNCDFTGCTTSALAVSTASVHIYCSSYGNSTPGIGGTTAYRCISFGNTGANGNGIQASFNIECASYGNSQSGFLINTTTGYGLNCISEGNGAFAYRRPGGAAFLYNCADFGNTSGRGSVNQDSTPITGTSSFFVNAAGGNFSLNNTAGGGALLRATAFPASLPGVSGTISYLDVGAVQHQDTGGVTGGSYILGG